MIRKEFTIVVEISDTTERVITGGITAQHIAAAFNSSNTTGSDDAGGFPLGLIEWAKEYQPQAPDVEEVGWYIVGVKA